MILRFIILLLFFYTGCSPLLITSASFGGVLLGGLFLSKTTDKTVLLEDSTISNNINIKLLKVGNDIFHKLTIHVFEGKVLCIGELASIQQKNLALHIINSVEGVKEIFDEIKLVAKPQNKFTQILIDSNITASIKLKTILHKNTLAFSNYNVITFKNVVYLFGVAQSQYELSKVINIASNTKYVQEVRNYVRVDK